MTSSDLWDPETAERYDDTSAFMFEPDVLDPAVDFLADLADDGPALELAIGTGRVAIPLANRGIAVSGIELSEPMIDQLHRKKPDFPVVVGDMATSTLPGRFSLVYLVWNGLGNLRTQAEQVACFRNAARHLAPGGRFVIELWIPGIRRFPPGQDAVPFHVGESHVGFDTYDMATQQGISHHYTRTGRTRFRRGARTPALAPSATRPGLADRRRRETSRRRDSSARACTGPSGLSVADYTEDVAARGWPLQRLRGTTSFGHARSAAIFEGSRLSTERARRQIHNAESKSSTLRRSSSGPAATPAGKSHPLRPVT